MSDKHSRYGIWGFWTFWVLANSVTSFVFALILLTFEGLDLATAIFCMVYMVPVVFMSIPVMIVIELLVKKYKPSWHQPLRWAVKAKAMSQCFLLPLPVLSVIHGNFLFLIFFSPEFLMGFFLYSIVTPIIRHGVYQPFSVISMTAGVGILMLLLIWLLAFFAYLHNDYYANFNARQD